MNLADREKEQLKAMIDAGQPLPPRFKAVLFDQPHEAELIWPGKTHEVTNVALPFQSIEQIDEPRAGTAGGTPDLFALDTTTGRQAGGWTNKLIWGDKLVLASLKNGPLRREIDATGGLKLVYIDPPFDVGASQQKHRSPSERPAKRCPLPTPRPPRIAQRPSPAPCCDNVAIRRYQRMS